MAAVPSLPVQTSTDRDPGWLDALSAVINRGRSAHYLIGRSARAMRRKRVAYSYAAYVNHPARSGCARRAITRSKLHPFLRALERALAMVLRASRRFNLGGHIASFASAATLYVRLQPLLARPPNTGGDMVYVQGHSSPGIYARVHSCSGRLTERQMDRPPRGRRQGAVVVSASVADAGLLGSSRPCPWAGADHGQLPTRFMKYLHDRGARYARTARYGASSATARWTNETSAP